MELGYIRPSKSPYVSPIVVTKKVNDGQSKYRIVGDYRALNAHTVPDKYPLPHIIDPIFRCKINILRRRPVEGILSDTHARGRFRDPRSHHSFRPVRIHRYALRSEECRTDIPKIPSRHI